MSKHDSLLHDFKQFSANAKSSESFMSYICERLHQEMVRYNWTCFYLLDQSDPTVLVEGAHTGSFASPHVRIPLNKGLCGAAASLGKTIVVDDLDRDSRALRDSELAKSEIVAPIFSNLKVVGVMDVSSYFLATFSATECRFVESCAAIVGGHLAQICRTS
jgi:L-methionine (R)-S-oxide reductase